MTGLPFHLVWNDFEDIDFENARTPPPSSILMNNEVEASLDGFFNSDYNHQSEPSYEKLSIVDRIYNTPVQELTDDTYNLTLNDSREESIQHKEVDAYDVRKPKLNKKSSRKGLYKIRKDKTTDYSINSGYDLTQLNLDLNNTMHSEKLSMGEITPSEFSENQNQRTYHSNVNQLSAYGQHFIDSDNTSQSEMLPPIHSIHSGDFREQTPDRYCTNYNLLSGNNEDSLNCSSTSSPLRERTSLGATSLSPFNGEDLMDPLYQNVYNFTGSEEKAEEINCTKENYPIKQSSPSQLIHTTSEEKYKRAKDLNNIASRRYRKHKVQKFKDLEDEAIHLERENASLRKYIGESTSLRNECKRNLEIYKNVFSK